MFDIDRFNTVNLKQSIANEEELKNQYEQLR